MKKLQLILYWLTRQNRDNLSSGYFHWLTDLNCQYMHTVYVNNPYFHPECLLITLNWIYFIFLHHILVSVIFLSFPCVLALHFIAFCYSLFFFPCAFSCFSCYGDSVVPQGSMKLSLFSLKTQTILLSAQHLVGDDITTCARASLTTKNLARVHSIPLFIFLSVYLFFWVFFPGSVGMNMWSFPIRTGIISSVSQEKPPKVASVPPRVRDLPSVSQAENVPVEKLKSDTLRLKFPMKTPGGSQISAGLEEWYARSSPGGRPRRQLTCRAMRKHTTSSSSMCWAEWEEATGVSKLRK